MKCQVNHTIKDGSGKYWISRHSKHSFVGELDDTDYCVFHGTKKECQQWIDARRKVRDDILKCALYQVQESVVSRDILIALDKDVSRDIDINPKRMMSVCLSAWSKPGVMTPSEEFQFRVETELRACLIKSLSWSAGTRRAQANKWRKLMRSLRK